MRDCPPSLYCVIMLNMDNGLFVGYIYINMLENLNVRRYLNGEMV